MGGGQDANGEASRSPVVVISRAEEGDGGDAESSCKMGEARVIADDGTGPSKDKSLPSEVVFGQNAVTSDNNLIAKGLEQLESEVKIVRADVPDHVIRIDQAGELTPGGKRPALEVSSGTGREANVGGHSRKRSLKGVLRSPLPLDQGGTGVGERKAGEAKKADLLVREVFVLVAIGLGEPREGDVSGTGDALEDSGLRDKDLGEDANNDQGRSLQVAVKSNEGGQEGIDVGGEQFGRNGKGGVNGGATGEETRDGMGCSEDEGMVGVGPLQGGKHGKGEDRVTERALMDDDDGWARDKRVRHGSDSSRCEVDGRHRPIGAGLNEGQVILQKGGGVATREARGGVEVEAADNAPGRPIR